MDKLYNAEIKERYLNEQYGENEGSQTTVRYLFYKTELIEDILKKDLYNFNLEEIGKAISNTNPYSANVAKSHSRFISKYISWSISAGLRDNNIHPMKGTSADWAVEFVDKTKKIHFSFTEMNDMVEGLQNAQDQALIWLLFEGVQGERFSEIRHLNYYTVNWETNELYLQDDNGAKRTVTVTDQCMRYIKNAYEQEVYRSEKEKERPLMRSDFILRNAYAPRSKSEDISLSGIYGRIHMLKDKLDLLYLTPNALKQSGMIWEAVKAYNEEQEVGYEQLAKIGEKYNFSKITSSTGYEYFNTHLMREFLNTESIKKLYNIEIIIDIR